MCSPDDLDWALSSRAAHKKAKLIISITVYFVLHACLLLTSSGTLFRMPAQTFERCHPCLFVHFFVGQYVCVVKV